MDFKPTDEQLKIFKFLRKRPENLLIEAYAGAGKTTTLIEAAKLLPQDKKILFLAFNKHIQLELKEKLPEHIRCYTSHGLGLAAIKRKHPTSKLDEFKIDKIIKKLSKKWDLMKEFDGRYDKVINYQNDMKKLANLCRLSLTTTDKYIPYLAERYDVRIFPNRDIKRIKKILDISTKDRQTFDFCDMVYLPAIDNSLFLFPQDYVIVDECQDINRAQQRIIEKSLRKDKISKKVIGRLIAIGDGFQSIYGFTGIMDKTFDWFKKYNNTKTLPLSYSFRCAKNIIEHANTIVPGIKALSDAPDGVVRDGDVLLEARSEDFILCRTVKPLIKLFFQFLEMDRKATIKGSDIGLDLINMIGKIKSIGKLNDHWSNEVIKYKNDLKKQGILNHADDNGYTILADKVDTLLFLAEKSVSIDELKKRISTIFTEDVEGIVLSTVHKAKGLEADRVFIIRPDKLPLPNKKPWQAMQEQNLHYVAITRAKTELIYDRTWSDETIDGTDDLDLL